MDKKNKIRDWWSILSIDDKIWIMMKYGFEKFNPSNVTFEQIQKLYLLENG